jgi:hypothetical protein
MRRSLMSSDNGGNWSRFMRNFLISFSIATSALVNQPAMADCKAELTALLQKSQDFGPYHVKVTTTSDSGNLAYEGKINPPKEFDINMQQGRMVMTEKGLWMENGGQWQAMPAEMGAMMRDMIQQGIAQAPDMISRADCLGKQDYAGGSYEAYSFDTAGEAMGIKSKATVTLYADENGRANWVVVDGEAMGMKSHTVQKITYDASITISPPN